jgi:hypothetical protein
MEITDADPDQGGWVIGDTMTGMQSGASGEVVAEISGDTALVKLQDCNTPFEVGDSLASSGGGNWGAVSAVQSSQCP